MGSPLLRHRTGLAAGTGLAAALFVWIVAVRGPDPAALAAQGPPRALPAPRAAEPAPLIELPGPRAAGPGAPAAEPPRDLECVRCELAAPEDPRMANLAPVDALLTDAFTGKPVPHAVLRAWDQNNVSLILRSDARGRIVTEGLLKGGPLWVEYASPPYVREGGSALIRQEQTVEHAAEWGVPDRWSVPTAALVPVALAGPAEARAGYHLYWSDPARQGVDRGPAAQLLPRSMCSEELRSALHPATTHIASMRPRLAFEQQETLLGPSSLPDLQQTVVNRDPLESAAKLLFCTPDQESYTVGSVTFQRPIRLGGKPFLLDVRTVAEDETDEFESALGAAWRTTVTGSWAPLRTR